jgi:hypothetical protein
LPGEANAALLERSSSRIERRSGGIDSHGAGSLILTGVRAKSGKIYK